MLFFSQHTTNLEDAESLLLDGLSGLSLNLQYVETNGLGKRSALSNGDDISDLDGAESR